MAWKKGWECRVNNVPPTSFYISSLPLSTKISAGELPMPMPVKKRLPFFSDSDSPFHMNFPSDLLGHMYKSRRIVNNGIPSPWNSKKKRKKKKNHNEQCHPPLANPSTLQTLNAVHPPPHPPPTAHSTASLLHGATHLPSTRLSYDLII